MKKISSDFSFSYKTFIKNFVWLKIFFVFLISIQQVNAQWCVPGSAWIVSGGYGIDPPSFRVMPPYGPQCQSMDFGYRPIEQCPLSPWPYPPTFTGTGLSDTCVLLSNGTWIGSFSANVVYCWGTHTRGAGLVFSNNGNMLRVPAALEIVPLNSPPGGDTGTSVTTVILWSSVSGANNYRLTIYTENCCINPVFDTLTPATGLTVPPGFLSGYYRYHWRVKPYGAAGEGPYSDPTYFTTGVSQAPRVLYPPDNAEGIKINPILDWQDLKPSSKYWLQLSTQPGFESLIINDSNLTETLFQAPSLNYNTYYYWRVAAKNSLNWGPFSDWQFKTVYLPGQVMLNYPSNNAIGIPTSLICKWYKAIETSLAGSSGNTIKSLTELINNHQSPVTIDKYGFELTTDTLLNPVVQDTSLMDTARVVSGLSLGTTYYWRVKARNPMGWGPFSDWWKFTTVDNVPLLLSPADQQHEVPVSVFFDWSDIAGGLKYRLQASAFSNFSSLWIDDSSLTVSEKQVNPGIFAYNSSYYWRVKARNSTGWGEYQTPFRFFTQENAPPILSSPANGSSGIPLTALLDWNDVSGAAKFRVQVSGESAFGSLITDDSSITASQYQVPPGLLLMGEMYYWRAAVKKNNLWSVFSSGWNFITVDSIPQSPQQVSPQSGSIQQYSNLAFTWNKAVEINLKSVRSTEKSGKYSAISGYWFELAEDSVSLSGLIRDTY
jgi:hypothetical protein